MLGRHATDQILLGEDSPSTDDQIGADLQLVKTRMQGSMILDSMYRRTFHLKSGAFAAS